MAPRLWPLSGLRNKADTHDLQGNDAIAQLLADADESEMAMLDKSNPAEEFDTLMDEILETPAEELAPAPADAPIPAPVRRPEPLLFPNRPAPNLATDPGDLVFVFGLRDDALTVAQSLKLATPTIEVAVAGAIGKPGTRHVGGRREALQARADGVRRGGSTVVAVGVGQAPGEADQYASILEDVVPDQIWIAIDVTRKPEDTRAWAHLVAEAGGGIDAVAAIGVAYTTTPDSTSSLGIPVGWADNNPVL